MRSLRGRLLIAALILALLALAGAGVLFSAGSGLRTVTP
jgi:hypothetical protein